MEFERRSERGDGGLRNDYARGEFEKIIGGLLETQI